MAMLGMQAETQLYFPGYCSTRDLNLNASCFIWPPTHVDKISKNGHYFNENLDPSSLVQYLTYKERLKQTMLQHEAIFRDQIHELHRLYNRQRELMEEMKRIKFHGHHLQLETPHTNQTSLECFHRTHEVSALPWLNPAFSLSSISGAENQQNHLKYVEGKIIQDVFSTFKTEGSRKETLSMESKRKKFGKRILDLELPADEYIDSEQEESLAGETAPSEVSVYPVKAIAKDVQKSVVESLHGINNGNLVFQGYNMSQASSSRGTKCLADLNEPIKLEEETDPESNVFLGPVPDLRLVPGQDLSAKRNPDFEAQPKEAIQNTQTGADPDSFSSMLHLERDEGQQECRSDNDEAVKGSSEVNSFPEKIFTEKLSEDVETEQLHEKHIKRSADPKFTRDIDLNSMSSICCSDVATHSISITNGEEKCKESTGGLPLYRTNPAQLVKSNKTLHLDCNSMPDSGEQQTTNDRVLGSKHDYMSSGFVFHVDLNSCINDDDSSPVTTLSKEIDLQAPASPENKETSPPRRESDENQLEMPSELPKQETRDLLDDLITVAAETIISISSSQVQTFSEIMTSKPSGASHNDSLYWFSKIASSVVGDPESELGVVLSFRNTDCHDDYLSDGLDYFEAMTLKLKDTEVEQYCCKTKILNEEAASPPSFPIQGRTRRRRQQRKDFQSEILPSLASLSRYEVTEDLQAIGGLIEASHQNTGARRTGRNGWTRGRRRRRPSTSSAKAETSLCTLLKQQTANGEPSIEESGLIGWGKITRRRRGQRCPSSNPGIILSQV